MPATARLFINDRDVGKVVLKSLADSWGFGEFTPTDAFAEFAPLFGNWSLLIHADDGEKRLSKAAADELRAAEYALDALHAHMLTEPDQRKVEVRQLNIDGHLIEWKVVGRNGD